ncbi:MAG: M23 family metallopeptidase [Candidatus Goldiibacteriota bacterium]|jgi:murein DD-endopeptidase MepM/ murein hydrolase activator NlpD
MKEFLSKAAERISGEVKILSFKRILLLSGFITFSAAIIFASIFISTGETSAYSSIKPQSFNDILRDKKQNLGALYKDSFSEIAKRDKDLAFIYMREKFRGKNVSYFIYKVKPKENFWTVAKKYGINIDTIIGANPELDGLSAYTNQQLIILSKKGVVHEINDTKENVQMLSDLYRVSKDTILQANNLNFGVLKQGDLLFIPDAKPVFISDNLKKLYAKRSIFRSPLAGKYTSLFGMRVHPVTGELSMHQGVDIRADMGSWVGASADGKVIFAGWGGNLGYCIKIAHKDGYITVYGHLSKILVHEGQNVFAGKLIAKTGNSGRTTGPHLHFAIYKDGKLLDPLKFLW